MLSAAEMYECPVCLQIMVEPVKLECKHTFCQWCLSNINNFSAETYKCPMCRKVYSTQVELKIDQTIQDKIKDQFPQKFNERILQLQKIKEEALKYLKIKLIYGNRHQELNTESNNKHKWTVFVDIERKGLVSQQFQNASEIISEVQYRLHPTFNPPVVTVKEYPFQLVRHGWGTFLIYIKITFKEKFNLPSINLEHYLSFDGNGETVAHQIQLNGNQQQ